LKSAKKFSKGQCPGIFTPESHYIPTFEKFCILYRFLRNSVS
jgi:hypothetical protein